MLEKTNETHVGKNQRNSNMVNTKGSRGDKEVRRRHRGRETNGPGADSSKRLLPTQFLIQRTDDGTQNTRTAPGHSRRLLCERRGGPATSIGAYRAPVWPGHNPGVKCSNTHFHDCLLSDVEAMPARLCKEVSHVESDHSVEQPDQDKPTPRAFRRLPTPCAHLGIPNSGFAIPDSRIIPLRESGIANRESRLGCGRRPR